MQRIPWQVVLISASQRVLCSEVMRWTGGIWMLQNWKKLQLEKCNACSVDSSQFRSTEPNNNLLCSLCWGQETKLLAAQWHCQPHITAHSTPEPRGYCSLLPQYNNLVNWCHRNPSLLSKCLERNPPCSVSCTRRFSINGGDSDSGIFHPVVYNKIKLINFIKFVKRKFLKGKLLARKI